MGLYSDVLMLSRYVPGWKKGFTGQFTVTDKQGSYICYSGSGGGVYLPYDYCPYQRRKCGHRFIHRESTMNDTVTSQGSTRVSRERPRTNLLDRVTKRKSNPPWNICHSKR